MLYACRMQYAMPRCCAILPVLLKPSSMRPPAGRPALRAPAQPLPSLLSSNACRAKVSVCPWHSACIPGSWPGPGDASGQALCRSPVVGPAPLQSSRPACSWPWMLLPPGPSGPSGPSRSLPLPPPPSPHRPRLWPASCTCRANLPRARSCSSRNSIPARFPALNQTFVSLSLPVLSCPLPVSASRPSHLLPRWCMHLHRVRSLSTNWHLLGSDRDTKTKLGTNPSISSKLAGPQDRHLEPPARVLTPRPVQLLPSLCVWGARTSCFLGLHRVYFSSAVTPENCQNSHSHSHPRSRSLSLAHCVHTSPVPS